MTGREPDYLFVGGLDLGLTRDCAAFVVLGIPDGGKSGKIRLAHSRLWRPTLGAKINLLDVERHVLEVDQEFDLEFVAFDPWQAEHLAQTLEADSNRRSRNHRTQNLEPFMREVPPVAANLRKQATLTIESFQDRRFQFYDCEPLRRDLHKLRVEEKSYGCRLTSPRDGEGHGDTFSAFALALLLGHEAAGKGTLVLSPINLEGPTGGRDYFADFASRQAAYDREQGFLNAPDPDPSGILDAIRSGNFTISPTHLP